MTIDLSLPPDVEAELRRQVEATGKDLASFVREAVEERLAVADDVSETNGHGRTSAQQRIEKLRAWIASHRPLPYEADDTRESIYEGCGE